MPFITQLLSFAGAFALFHIFGRQTPVLSGFKITHRCNLSCRHCPYWQRTGQEQDYDGVLETLRTLRAMGGRILILEGGEPLLWRDRGRDLSHVVDAARELFGSVCITTNGTMSWDGLPLDRVWVSLDGTPEHHDRIRGAGTFERVMANIEACGQERTFVSTTINTENIGCITDFLEMIGGTVAGVTFQFHYPYNGLPDPLFISAEERKPVLDTLIRAKHAGLPVANSFGSLEDLKRPRWTCRDGLLANAEPDGSIFHGCYLKNRGESNCLYCGFAAHNEMSRAFLCRLESIGTGARIFFDSSRNGAERASLQLKEDI